MKNRLKIRPVRTGVQMFFFLLIALIAVGHSLEEAGITLPLIGGASLHAVCPFGGVVSIYKYMVSGTFVQKIHDSSFILMILVFLTAFLFGPIFCGWICPLGSFQEWIGRIGKKLFRKKYNHVIPGKIDSILRYLRYLVLIWVIIATAASARLVFANYDPYYALFNFWTGEVAVSGFIILGLVILLSLFVERPFCKYACPYGAVLGISNFFRVFKIRRIPKTCISCSVCDQACPMNIEVEKHTVVKNHQCIACYECTSEAACPISDTVVIAAGSAAGSVNDKNKEAKETSYAN